MKTNSANSAHAAARRVLFALVATLALLAIFQARTLLAQALNPAYLSEMPSVERVMKEMQASDPAETAARQMGAFWQLKQMIEDMAGPRFYKPGLTPDEARMRQAYYTAYWQISQSKPEYKAFPAMRGYDVSVEFRNDMFKRLFPPAFAAEYAKATAQATAKAQAMHQARVDAENREAENNKRAAETAQQQYAQQQAPPVPKSKSEREMDRCIESGRGELQCMAEGLGKGINGMIGEIAPGAEIPTPPPGLRLNGYYLAQTGSSFTFNSETVGVGCHEVMGSRAYTVEVKGDQIEVKTKDDSKAIVLALKADGKLAGSGPITITGSVPAGSTSSTTYGSTTTTTMEQKQISQMEARQYSAAEVHQNGQEYSVSQPTTHTTYGPTGTTTTPQYTTRTKSCTLGLMTPGTSVADAAMAKAMNMLDSGTSKNPPPVGLRMNGTYTGPGGLEIEFQPDSAEVQCGQAVLAIPYMVERKENQILVNIKSAAGPVVLTLDSARKLRGSGQIQVNGRTRSATCPVGVLTAGEAASGGAAAPKSSTTPARTTAATSLSPSASPAPATTAKAAAAAPRLAMSTAAAPTGNAILSLASAFTAQTGAPNPIAGHAFVLLRDNYVAALAKGGFQVPDGTSPIKALVAACTNKSPDCQTGVAAINADTAAGIKLDANGKAIFPGVPPGTYYLVGSLHNTTQFIYWDLPVELKAGANSITLDQNNSKPAER
jgi:hypothetical protein